MTTPPMVYVYSAGHGCLGFVMTRGVAGFEAFDREQQSLGIFPTQQEAAAAIICEKKSPATKDRAVIGLEDETSIRRRP